MPSPMPAHASLRLPVRASPPLSDLTGARCSFFSSSAVALEVEKGSEQKHSRGYASMTCRGRPP